MGDVKSGEIPQPPSTTWDDWRPENGDFEDPQISWFLDAGFRLSPPGCISSTSSSRSSIP